jgi:hypothetical protein
VKRAKRIAVVKRLYLLLLALVVVGCATQSNQLGNQQRLPEPGVGYVLASLTYEVPSDPDARTLAFVPALTVMYSPVEGGSGQHFSIHTSNSTGNTGMWSDKKLALDDGMTRRLVLLVPVRPGKYRVKQYYSSFPVFGREVFIDAKEPPTFEVREGEIAYAGSVQLSFSVGKTLFGQLRPNVATIKLVHELDKDVRAARDVDSRLAKIEVRDAYKAP